MRYGKLTAIAAILLLSLTFCSAYTDAEGTFTVDGISYQQTSEGTVKVVGAEISDTIVIPSNVQYEDIDYKVTSVGDSAFRSCAGISTIILPSTLTYIENGAFKSCSIRSLFILSENCTHGSGSFDSCNTEIFVSEDSLSSYRSSENWKQLANRISPYTLIDTPYRIMEYDGTEKVFMSPTKGSFSDYSGTFAATELGSYEAKVTPNAENGYLWKDTMTCEQRTYVWSVADPYIGTIPVDPPAAEDSTPLVVALWVIVGVLVAIIVLALIRKH